MSAFDKTAQGTAVLEASGNAGAEAPDGKARRAVGEIPALRADEHGVIRGRNPRGNALWRPRGAGRPIHTSSGAVCCCRPLG